MSRPGRVVLAPNAFKGTFSALEVVAVWTEALVAGPDLDPVPVPLSDGGDGFVDVVRHYRPDVLEVATRVPGPRGTPVVARWGWQPDDGTAFVESAAAVGLELLGPEERDPLAADSVGLGRLLAAVAGLGASEIVVGLGGSATVDGGLGMARALGFRFEDAAGRPVVRPADLAGLARVVPPPAPPLPASTRLVALADVETPLLGGSGAAATFGAQKGAGPEAIERLEAGLARLSARWSEDLGAEAGLPGRPGAGAAGGLGAGTVAFLNAVLVPGAAWCARLAGLEAALAGAAGVITGEGRYDPSSHRGKATGHVVAAARAAGVPVTVVCGRVEAAAGAVGDAEILEGRHFVNEGEALDRRRLGELARKAAERFVAPSAT